jgi:hypothetical protein
MLFRHMRRLLPAVLLLCTLSAQGEEWVVRRPEAGPARGVATGLAVASSARETIALWHGWGGLQVARLTADGMQLANRVSIPLEDSWIGSGAVASDGTDFLVAYAGSNTPPRIVRISGGSGELTPGAVSPVLQESRPMKMEWNGHAYLLLFTKRADTIPLAVLLDRGGAVVSGVLRLDGTWIESVSLAASGGSWLVTGSYGPVSGGGIVTARNFPPVGETAPLLLPQLFGNGVGRVRVADRGNGRGFLSVREENGRLLLQALGETRREFGGQRSPDGFPAVHAPGAARAVAPEGAATVAGDAVLSRRLSLVCSGGAAYVSYISIPFVDGPPAYGWIAEVAGGEVTTLPLLHELQELVIAPGGRPLAFTVSTRDWQLYAEPVSAAGGPVDGLLVSRDDQELRLPHVLSAGGMHLAAWTETRRSTVPAFALLGADGRPLAPPVAIDDAVSWSMALAFSGSSFLMVWDTGKEVHGGIVSLDGKLQKGPFVVASTSAPPSAVWDAGRYVVTAGKVVVRLSSDGTLLDTEPFDLALDPKERYWDRYAYLAANGDGFVAVVESTFGLYCTCPVQVDYDIYTVGADLTPTGAGPLTFRGLHGAMAFAAGGGHFLVIWDEGYFPERAKLHLVADGTEHYVEYGSRRVPLSAAWNGSEFLVAAGNRLAHHAPGGELLRVEELPADVTYSAVSSAGLVLMVRNNVLTATLWP